MSRPRISAVIPCFDAGRTLPETLASLRGQRRRPDQVVVVDDGSTDRRTRALLDRLPPWVTLVRQANQGPGPARNAGIDRSDGELVLTLDADDRLRRDGLALLEQALASDPGAAFAYGQLRWFGAQRGTGVPPRFNGYLELDDNRVPYCALFRREVFSTHGLRYPPRPRSGSYEDWSLWLDCAARGLRAAVVEEPILEYRCKRDGGVLNASHAIRAALVADLRAQHPALYSPEGRAALKARDAPALELSWSGGDDDGAAALALLAAQGLPDSRLSRAPATARALLLAAGGKYLLAPAPALLPALAAAPRALAAAVAALEATGHAWARLAPSGGVARATPQPPGGDRSAASEPAAPALLRLHALSGLLESDLAATAPPSALADLAVRAAPGLLLAGDPAAWPALATVLARPAAAAPASRARAAWKLARGAAERLAGEARVGRALQPLKLRLDQLRPLAAGARRALGQRRLPRGLRFLVPASVREERAMLDTLPPGAPEPAR